MSAPQKFRTAFHGFNREDVAHYLEYLNSKHTAQINQLNSENEFLRTRLETAEANSLQPDTLTSLEQERDELRTQLEELQQKYNALELAQAATPSQGTCADAELETYRRAERTERIARERADLIQRQANVVLAEASVRVNDAAAQILPAADQLLSQLQQLQTAISAGRKSLQDASVILTTLRSDD